MNFAVGGFPLFSVCECACVECHECNAKTNRCFWGGRRCAFKSHINRIHSLRSNDLRKPHSHPRNQRNGNDVANQFVSRPFVVWFARQICFRWDSRSAIVNGSVHGVLVCESAQVWRLIDFKFNVNAIYLIWNQQKNISAFSCLHFPIFNPNFFCFFVLLFLLENLHCFRRKNNNKKHNNLLTKTFHHFFCKALTKFYSNGKRFGAIYRSHPSAQWKFNLWLNSLPALVRARTTRWVAWKRGVGIWKKHLSITMVTFIRTFTHVIGVAVWFPAEIQMKFYFSGAEMSVVSAPIFDYFWCFLFNFIQKDPPLIPTCSRFCRHFNNRILQWPNWPEGFHGHSILSEKYTATPTTFSEIRFGGCGWLWVDQHGVRAELIDPQIPFRQETLSWNIARNRERAIGVESAPRAHHGFPHELP